MSSERLEYHQKVISLLKKRDNVRLKNYGTKKFQVDNVVLARTFGEEYNYLISFKGDEVNDLSKDSEIEMRNYILDFLKKYLSENKISVHCFFNRKNWETIVTHWASHPKIEILIN